jgi:hypothetical protein
MKGIVEMFETRLRAAMLAGDVIELDNLIADDLTFTDHAGSRSDQAHDLAAHRSGTLRLERLELSDRDIRLFDNGAVVTVRADFAGSYTGAPFAGIFAYTRTWIRRAEG